MASALCIYEDNRIHSACAIIDNGRKLNDFEVKEIYSEGTYYGMPIVYTLPGGNLPDYLYIDGKFVYDPRPEPEQPEPETAGNLEQRVAAVESDVAALTTAIEKGLAL